ncbi:hypothetical protein D3C86_1932880 [compost metagenome]
MGSLRRCEIFDALCGCQINRRLSHFVALGERLRVHRAMQHNVLQLAVDHHFLREQEDVTVITDMTLR